MLRILKVIGRFLNKDGEGTGFAALWAFLIRGGSAAFAFVVQIILARLLGVSEYGIFASVWVFVTITGHLLPLGFGQSATRFMAEYRTAEAPSMARGFLHFSRVVVLLSSMALTIGLALLLYGAPDWFDRTYTAPLLIGAFCLPLFALQDLFEGQAKAQGWTGLSLIPVYIARQALFLAGVVIAIIAGFKGTATTAMGAFFIALFLSTAVQWIWLALRHRGLFSAGEQDYQPTLWMKTSLPMFLSDSLALLLTYTDILILTLFLEPKWVAIYFAVTRVGALLGFVQFAVSTAAARRFASLMVKDDLAAIHTFSRHTVGWTFWPTLLAVLVICAIGWPVLGIFGTEFDAGYWALVLIALGYLARSTVGGAEDLLAMTGRERTTLYCQAAAAVANIGFNFLLIPLFGIEGAALATTLSVTVYSVLLNQSALKHYQINLFFCIIPRLPGSRSGP